MFAIICGIIFIAFTVFSVLPMFPLNWGADVIAFLKGSLPVLAAFVGLICLLGSGPRGRTFKSCHSDHIECP